METTFVEEPSLSKQQTISKQRRERAKSDGLDELYSEEKIQKMRLIEEPANFNCQDAMIQETKTQNNTDNQKSTKVRAMSLTVQKDRAANIYYASNKRDLMPVALQKQLNGSRRNKKLSLDETISKLKVPSAKSTTKNLEKMRFLAGIQQQELEALIRGRASYYSSNSNSPQLNSPVLSHTEGSMSPENVSYYPRNGLNPTPSHFSKNFQEFTSEYNPSVESDMMSDSSRNQMAGTTLPKVQSTQSSQFHFFESEISQQNLNPSYNPSQYNLPGPSQLQYQMSAKNESLSIDLRQQFGKHHVDYGCNGQPDRYQNEAAFSSSLQQVNSSPQQQNYQPQQQISPQVVNQMRNIQDSPKHYIISPDKSSCTNYAGDCQSSPSRRGYVGEQELKNELSWSTASNQHYHVQNPSNFSQSMTSTSFNPADMADQQLMRVRDLLSKKSAENSQTSTPKNGHSTPKSGGKHKKSRSLSSASQTKLNLASNLNALQLQSNLVPEKFINSPLQGMSPAISRTNTDPNQLKNLINSMKAEKQTFNSALHHELNLLNDEATASVDQDEGPPLIRTGTGGGLLYNTGVGALQNAGNGSILTLDENPHDSDSILNLSGAPLIHTTSGGLFGLQRKDENEKAPWDPFAPLISSSKTDNTAIANYIRSKTNANFLNAPASNFKTANFPSKPQHKSPIYQPEEPPTITQTRTDPNGLKDLIRSMQSSPSKTELSNDSPLVQKFSQVNPLNSDPLYSNPSFFGQAQRLNTNPTHLASLIKSMHSQNNQQATNKQSMPSVEMSLSRNDLLSTNPTYINSLRSQQPDSQVRDCIPSLLDLDVQNPITRTRTDPTDWRSLLKGNNINKASQFSHQRTQINLPQINSQNHIDVGSNRHS